MNQPLIDKTAAHVRELFATEASGHDWWHIYRVWKTAQRIAEATPEADGEIVELGALLHDIADWKFHGGDDLAGPTAARKWLEEQGVDVTTIHAVTEIVRYISFKGAGTEAHPLSLEGKIVQDADRLDAIGAIGIARAFAYGGHAGRLLYDPDVAPVQHQTAEQYKTNQSHTINHFYEKLLLLKDRMNTDAGRKMAQQRHEVMEQFLDEFYAEWDGKK